MKKSTSPSPTGKKENVVVILDDSDNSSKKASTPLKKKDAVKVGTSVQEPKIASSPSSATKNMSIKELKQELQEKGIDISGCVEKEDLVALLNQSKGSTTKGSSQKIGRKKAIVIDDSSDEDVETLIKEVTSKHFPVPSTSVPGDKKPAAIRVKSSAASPVVINSKKRKVLDDDDDDFIVDDDDDDVPLKKKKAKVEKSSSTKGASGKSYTFVPASSGSSSKVDVKEEVGEEEEVKPKKKNTFYARKAAGGDSSVRPARAGERDLPLGAPLCLKDKTFVITGVQNFHDRSQIEELIKEYGGKITGAVVSWSHVAPLVSLF